MDAVLGWLVIIIVFILIFWATDVTTYNTLIIETEYMQTKGWKITRDTDDDIFLMNKDIQLFVLRPRSCVRECEIYYIGIPEVKNIVNEAFVGDYFTAEKLYVADVKDKLGIAK